MFLPGHYTNVIYKALLSNIIISLVLSVMIVTTFYEVRKETNHKNTLSRHRHNVNESILLQLLNVHMHFLVFVVASQNFVHVNFSHFRMFFVSDVERARAFSSDTTCACRAHAVSVSEIGLPLRWIYNVTMNPLKSYKTPRPKISKSVNIFFYRFHQEKLLNCYKCFIGFYYVCYSGFQSHY